MTIVEDDASGQTILEIEVRGKRGVGYCRSMAGAVRRFERLKARPQPAATGGLREEAKETETAKTDSVKRRLPQPADLLFPKWQREIFEAVLEEENLKFDGEGRPRTAYSPRHTYICLRLMEGADISQIGKNCRTGIEMIEKYDASHIKTNLDAAAINIMRLELKKKQNQSKPQIASGHPTPQTDV